MAHQEYVGGTGTYRLTVIDISYCIKNAGQLLLSTECCIRMQGDCLCDASHSPLQADTQVTLPNNAKWMRLNLKSLGTRCSSRPPSYKEQYMVTIL